MDEVREPEHYAGDGHISCMRAMKSMLEGNAADTTAIESYWQASALKYLWRFTKKGRYVDLQKARRCIEYLEKEYAGRILRVTEADDE